jgi:hypothetical protein
MHKSQEIVGDQSPVFSNQVAVKNSAMATYYTCLEQDDICIQT